MRVYYLLSSLKQIGAKHFPPRFNRVCQPERQWPSFTHCMWLGSIMSVAGSWVLCGHLLLMISVPYRAADS